MMNTTSYSQKWATGVVIRDRKTKFKLPNKNNYKAEPLKL